MLCSNPGMSCSEITKTVRATRTAKRNLTKANIALKQDKTITLAQAQPWFEQTFVVRVTDLTGFHSHIAQKADEDFQIDVCFVPVSTGRISATSNHDGHAIQIQDGDSGQRKQAGEAFRRRPDGT